MSGEQGAHDLIQIAAQVVDMQWNEPSDTLDAANDGGGSSTTLSCGSWFATRYPTNEGKLDVTKAQYSANKNFGTRTPNLGSPTSRVEDVNLVLVCGGSINQPASGRDPTNKLSKGRVNRCRSVAHFVALIGHENDPTLTASPLKKMNHRRFFLIQLCQLGQKARL